MSCDNATGSSGGLKEYDKDYVNIINSYWDGTVSYMGSNYNVSLEIPDASSYIFYIANQEFILSRDNFKAVNRNEVYRIIYLPNSKYVIDVIDENGRSLLRE